MIRTSGSMATILREGDGTLFSDPVGAILASSLSIIANGSGCEQPSLGLVWPCQPAAGFLGEPLPPGLVPAHIDNDPPPPRRQRDSVSFELILARILDPTEHIISGSGVTTLPRRTEVRLSESPVHRGAPPIHKSKPNNTTV